MTNTIKTLQTELAQDLVKLEQSDISEENLAMIEDTYQQVYFLLNKIHKE
jgi:hypothetical protein